MKSKEIYQAIDLSKVGPELKTKLTALEKATDGFTNERADGNMDMAMNKIYAYLKEKKPESLKNIEVKTVEVEEKVETIVEGKPVKKTTKTKKKVAGKKKKVAKKTATPSSGLKKPTVSSVASKIRKPGESWSDALSRAKVIFNEKKQTQVAKTKKAVDDLRDFLKDDKNFTGWPRTYGKEKASDNSLERDSQRKAMPPGKRRSDTGRVYYENRDNRADREANSFPRKIFLKEGGDIMIEPTILQNNPDYLVGTETMYEMFDKGGSISKLLTFENNYFDQNMSYKNAKDSVVDDDESVKGSLKDALDKAVDSLGYKGEVAIVTFSMRDNPQFSGDSFGIYDIAFIYVSNNGNVKVKIGDGYYEYEKITGEKFDFTNYEPSEVFEKGGYVAVSEKDGYWYIMSKPSSKDKAQEVIEMGVPRGEKGKVVTLEEAKAYNKVIGREYLEKGGKISGSTTYVPNRSIKELSIILGKSLKTLKGTDIVDGVYVKNDALKSTKKSSMNSVDGIFDDLVSMATLKGRSDDIKVIQKDGIKKLLDAGYDSEDVMAIYLGPTVLTNVKIDNEIGIGLLDYRDDYVPTAIENFVEAAKNKTYELGLKFPQFNWSDILKKYKIDKSGKDIDGVERTNKTSPALVRGANDKEYYVYKIYEGDKVVVGTVMDRVRIINGKKDDDDYYRRDPEDLKNFQGGYWGVVSSDKKIILDIAKMILRKNTGYVKNMQIFVNGLGGVDAETLDKNKIPYELGGEVVIPTTYLDYNPDYLVGTNTMYEMFADGGMMAKGGILEQRALKLFNKLKEEGKLKRYLDTRGNGKKYFETIVPNYAENGFWRRFESTDGGSIGVLQDRYLDKNDVLNHLKKTMPVLEENDKMADGGSIPEGYHQMPDGSIMADSMHMAKGGFVYLYYGGEQPDEMMKAANEIEAASIAMKMGAEHYDFVAQMAKGGKIREFDDVLIISKNKLGMVEAIADNIYYVTTPFGESFEAALDDLQKVKSFSKGGAMEHRIFLGDKVIDIYKNVPIVRNIDGDIVALDFSQEPKARRFNINLFTEKNTLASAKEFIDADPSFKTSTMAMGGSLQGHGFEVGDLIVEDLGGYIRVVSEDGKDFFITLRTGDRETEAPLPFKYGGKVKHSDVTRLATKTNEAGDEVVDLTEFYEGGGNVPKVFDVPAQFLDAEGKRKNDRKTIKELTDFVLELPQTKEIYFNQDLGDYIPSRKKLHAEIINKFKKEVVCINNDKPIAIFMGGSPASGKSSFLRKYSPFLLKEEILKIDADEIRAMLPEYEGWNATQTHLETKDIVNTLLSNKNIGIPCDFDIIYDGTMNSVKSYIPLMDILRKRGYKIFIVFMDNVPKDVIIKRALDRYKSSGRFVPLEVIEDFFSKGKTAFNELKKDVDGYMRIDGSSQDYKVLEEGGMKLPRDREYSKLGTKIKASDIPVSYKKGGLSKLY